MRKAIHPLFLLLGLVLAVAATGCGGADDPAAPSGDRVTVETGRRVTRTIGPDGGELSTTGADGVVFTLAVPAAALPTEVEISMAPVSAIAELPWSGGLVAAVQLEPSGLVLVVPAILSMESSAALDGNQRLVGFSYEGEGGSLAPTAAIGGPGVIRVPVTHFSGAGAAAAGPGEPGFDPCADPDIGTRIMCIAPGLPEARARFLAAAREYLNEVVVPGVRGEAGLTLRDAVIDLYLRWYSFVNSFAQEYGAADWQDVLEADHDAALDLIASGLRQEIAALKADLCGDRPEIEVLIAIFELRWLAYSTGLDNQEYGLADEQTLEGLCAEVVVERFDLPDPMPVDQDLSVDVALRLDLDGTPVEIPFRVVVFGNVDMGSQNERCCGRTNAAGEFTTVVRRTEEHTIVLDVTAVPLLPLFSPQGGLTLAAVPIVGRAALTRGETRTTVSFPASVAPGVPTELRVLVEHEVSAGVIAPRTAAVVTCSVSGGSADPATAVTDGSGVARTMIEAAAGVDSVVVDFLVEADGVQVARGRVGADATGAIGVISLLERVSVVVAAVPTNQNCPSEENSDWSAAAGPLTLSAAANQFCYFEDPESGYVESVTAATFMSQTSDTGIATDGRSAVMTYSAVGGSSVSAVNSSARAFSNANFRVVFDVQGEPMTFELDAACTAIGNCSIEVRLETEQWEGYRWHWRLGDDAPSTVLVAGNLPPGRYHGSVNFSGDAFLSLRPESSYSAEVTLRLGQAKAAQP